MHACTCTCQCLRGHAMPFPKTKTPPLLGREDTVCEKVGNAYTHTHFFFLFPPPFCIIACYCTMEYYTPRDSRNSRQTVSESEFPWRGGKGSRLGGQ